MKSKLVLEIKNLAKELSISESVETSVLKSIISELYDKLTVLEFLENSISDISSNTTHVVEKKVEEPIEEIIPEEKTVSVTSTKTIVEKEEVTIKVDTKEEEIVETPSEEVIEVVSAKSLHEALDVRKSSLHEELKRTTINIGLNDRIAFVKKLFDGNQQDFHRVLSQINTFTTAEEVRNFIETMVKPEYNWDVHEEYALRFMEIVEGKFE